MRWIKRGTRCLVAGIWITALSQAQAPTATPVTPAAPATPPEKPLVIMIDAAHGGSDPGALLTPTSPEKEITLAVARRLRQELGVRGITAQLVRDGDLTLSADQRAIIANTTNPALYISLHASSQGTGLRVFTALRSGGESKGPFFGWGTAQSAVLERSNAIQADLVQAIRRTKFPIRALPAPLRPLNNVRAPAIAIEISPTTGDSAQVAASGYQQMICAAVANALAAIAPSLHPVPGRP